MALAIVRGLAPGSAIPSPAYLDANVLVSYFVQRSNSRAAVQAIAEMLAQAVETILSPLTIAEFWWAIFDALYNRDRAGLGMPPQRPTPGEYRRQRANIQGRYRNEIALIRQQLRSWPRLRSIAPRISGFRYWLAAVDDCTDHSDLLPSDAAHLALASRYARALITNDAGFARAATSSPGRALTIFIV